MHSVAETMRLSEPTTKSSMLSAAKMYADDSMAIFFGYFIDEANVIIWRYAVRRRLFSDPKMHDL